MARGTGKEPRIVARGRRVRHEFRGTRTGMREAFWFWLCLLHHVWAAVIGGWAALRHSGSSGVRGLGAGVMYRYHPALVSFELGAFLVAANLTRKFLQQFAVQANIGIPRT